MTKTPNFMEKSEDTVHLRSLVEQLVAVQQWHGEYADVLCPWEHDARLYINGTIPYLHCLHQRCASDVAAVNAELREATSDTLGGNDISLPLSAEEKAERERRKRLRRIKATAKNRLLSELLRKPEIIEEEWLRISPLRLGNINIKDHWKSMLEGLFLVDSEMGPTHHDIWIGELWETGSSEYKDRFRPCKEWLKCTSCPGPHISLGFFKTGSTSRNKESIVWQRFIVAESDSLSKGQFGNIINYVQHHLKLRAIVDTGGKSLHAWFDEPRPPKINFKIPSRPKDDDKKSPVEKLNLLKEWQRKHGRLYKSHDRAWKLHFQRRLELLALMEGLGCDPAMFRLASIARLPGCERIDSDGDRTGRWQRLLYLDPTTPLIKRS